jgi:proteasome activator subunit 4
LLNLLELSTSHYSAVRARAQSILLRTSTHFAHSYKLLVPRVTELLSAADTNISHEQFKGALYVIIGTKHKTMLAKHSWSTLEKLWPAAVDANRHG